MPSNLLTADTTFPTLTQEQSTDEKFEKITSYLYMLLEQLRYSMGNLDKENFNDAGLEEIANIITEPVYVQLKDDEANIAALTVTAAGLGARLSDAEGNITQLTATTTSLTSRISSAEGSISTLQQTATSLTSRISDAEGNISSLTQTVNGMTLSVTNGSSSSTIRLLANGVQLSSQSISFSGMVSFTDLSTSGWTTINGDNITTGTIEAIDIYGCTIEGSTFKSVLKDQNRESAAGVLGQQPVQGLDVTIPITTQGRLSTVSQFEEIVVRANADGSIIRLRDVARISLEAQSYNTESAINKENAAVLAIYMLPGANAMEVAKSVKEAMEEISKNFPEGMSYEIPFDMTTYISESIHEVYKTLFEALILVIIVVYLSLQSWRATVIPLVAVPISLIGTFGFMLIFGFSLNILTLLGLVLAIGIVVDDAIVVVENVERIMEEEKLSPYQATKKAMEGLTGAIIATSLVLAAVFVPVSFLGGITGQLYRQFTVTIVVSVLLSTVVALTLSPVMCSLILKPEDPNKKKNIVFRRINEWLAIGNHKYVGLIKHIVKHPRRVLSTFGMVLIAILLIHRIIPTSFLPIEDQGYFKIELELPEGATLERTRIVTERAVEYLMKNPAVEYVQSVAGSSPRVGTSQARSELTVILKPWEERDSQTIDNIMAQVKKDMSQYPECKVYLSTPPVIPGLGSSGGFEMQLEARGDATFENLVQATDTLMYYASKRKELSGLSSALQADIPQLYFDVDRDKVKFSGVPLADVFSTMKAYTGSVYVNDFNMFNRIYRVYIQAEAPYREHKENINLFFVRGTDNAMIPLTSLGTTSYTTGPGSIKRFNMFNSSVILGEAADGYSSGQAMEIIEQIAREHLPENIGVEWSGLSFQEKQAGGQTGMVLALVFMFVFLFLAALYESWMVPVAVLLSLPVAALGAYLGVWGCGLENDVYFQIGLVMLVGLAAKNAILIVEFAKEQVDKGVDVVQAALHASQLRFRPILMTSLAFILGMLPMVIASGPGSASRQAIGTGVFFGMIFAVTVGILLVPFFFVLIYKMKAKMKQK